MQHGSLVQFREIPLQLVPVMCNTLEFRLCCCTMRALCLQLPFLLLGRVDGCTQLTPELTHGDAHRSLTLSIFFRCDVLLRGQRASSLQLLRVLKISRVHVPEDLLRLNKFSTHALDTCVELLLLRG